MMAFMTTAQASVLYNAQYTLGGATCILILAVVVILVLALALYAVQLLPFPDPPFKQILQALLVVVAIPVIVQRSGLI